MKSKNPLFVIYNDLHLGVGNEEEILVSIRHMINYMIEREVDTVIFAGDFFHSRSNQTESVLNTAAEILRLIFEAGLRHILFPGNHDKTSYFTESSFMDTFKYHPGVEFYSDVTLLDIKGVSVTLIPFWDDSILVPKISEAKGSDLLISHFEMLGSSHLGKVSEKVTITPKTLNKWKRVYLGHYHNTMDITASITHLPSLRQNSFGEDSNKGFTIITEDLNYEIVPGVFKKFNKISLNIEELSSSDITELIELHKNSEDSVRFEFFGSESSLKALDKEQFQGTNIDIKLKYEKKYQDEVTVEPVLIKKFDKAQILKTFENFCEEKNYDYIQGLALLEDFFKRQGVA